MFFFVSLEVGTAALKILCVMIPSLEATSLDFGLFEKNQNGRPAATSDRQISSLTRFTQNFYVSLQNLYQISIPLIARMSLKLGKIRTETRSWRPKWPIIGHYFFNMCIIWKTGPHS